MSADPKKILIVEDERPLSAALELKFQSKGYNVTTAANGQVGLDLIAKNHYDAILLDLMMPVMDGFQVLEKLSSAKHMPLVLVVSNLTQPEDKDRALRLGAHKFLIKSEISLEEIVKEVKSLLSAA